MGEGGGREGCLARSGGSTGPWPDPETPKAAGGLSRGGLRWTSNDENRRPLGGTRLGRALDGAGEIPDGRVGAIERARKRFGRTHMGARARLRTPFRGEPQSKRPTARQACRQRRARGVGVLDEGEQHGDSLVSTWPRPRWAAPAVLARAQRARRRPGEDQRRARDPRRGCVLPPVMRER